MSVCGAFSPELFQAAIAPAPGAVRVVVRAVGLVEVLMTDLCRIELARSEDFGVDGTTQLFRDLGLGLLRELLLLRIMEVDPAPILIPAVAELPILRERIDVVPEDLQQFGVADFF